MTNTERRRREAVKFLWTAGREMLTLENLNWLMAAESEEDYKDRMWCLLEAAGVKATPQEVYEVITGATPLKTFPPREEYGL